jgi:vitellogenic carboxypeptidase-like protein
VLEEAVDPGEPLFLTPLLEAGKAAEARTLSQVHNLTKLISFSGYFSTNKKYDSNLFFWFFPAAVKPILPVHLKYLLNKIYFI